MGEGESAATESPFQSMKAVDRISAKLRSCEARCRGGRVVRGANIAVSFGGGGGGWGERGGV